MTRVPNKPSELIYDDDRLVGRALTPKEQEGLRRHFRDAAAVVREHFRRNPPLTDVQTR